MKTLLRFFLHLLYHPFAWAYDLVAAVVSLGRWRDWVADSLVLVEGPGVLELGSGPGHLQVLMHAHGLQPCGVDESPQMVRLAARRLRRLGLPCLLSRARAQALPLSGPFQTVVATFPSEYIFAPTTLGEIRRVLAPRGRLVLLMGAWIERGRILERAAAWAFQVTGQSPPSAQAAERFLEPLRQAGFEPELAVRAGRGAALLFVIAQKAAA